MLTWVCVCLGVRVCVIVSMQARSLFMCSKINNNTGPVYKKHVYKEHEAEVVLISDDVKIFLEFLYFDHME